MMLKKCVSLIALSITAAIVFSGCGKKEEEKSAATPAAQEAKAPQAAAPQGAQMVLTKFGPTKTKVGQAFNKQPDGSSAFWLNGENIVPSAVVVFNEAKLKSARRPDGKLITAGPVPKELFATPGTYPIYLLDTKTGAKSNEMKFVVE